eukprot:1153457-Pelagomonas_calceolata.AAC.4
MQAKKTPSASPVTPGGQMGPCAKCFEISLSGSWAGDSQHGSHGPSPAMKLGMLGDKKVSSENLCLGGRAVL